jgi:hypothetical protein
VCQWPHDQSSNPCKYKFSSLNCFKFWRIVNYEVRILLQKNKNKRCFDLWKLSQIESKHTQVDLKSLVSPSPHTMRIQMRCRIWPMGAQHIRSSFESSHSWFCAVVVRSVGCVRSLAHLPYPNLIKENRRMSTCNRLDLQTLGSQPMMPKNLPDHCFSISMAVAIWRVPEKSPTALEPCIISLPLWISLKPLNLVVQA